MIGKNLLIRRKTSTGSYRTIFNGEVILHKKNGGLYEVFASCKMHRTVRLEADYVYDSEVDLEGGVGSEIVKSLFELSGLNCDDDSVPTTGVINILKTFSAKGKIITNLKTLCEVYGRIVFYRDSDDKGYFIEPASEATATSLTTGVDIVGRPDWTSTGEDIINNVTVIGGRQIDWASEDFAGPTTEVVLTAVPLDTEVTAGSTRLERGVTSSNPNDFYVDANNKKIIFSSSQSNITVRYSYSVPIKVSYNDANSIKDTFRVDRSIIDTKILTSDDAELLSNEIVADKKNVINSTPLKVRDNNDIEIGQEIQVVDNINNFTRDVNVVGIEYYYPYTPDKVEVGLSPVDETDLNININRRIIELERQLSATSDVSVSLVDEQADLGTEVYIEVLTATADSGVLYWDSDTQGDWGNDAGTNGFNWGNDTEETYSEHYKDAGY